MVISSNPESTNCKSYENDESMLVSDKRSPNYSTEKLEILYEKLKADEKIFIKNEPKFKELLISLIEAAPGRIQVITDFDRTLSSFSNSCGIVYTSYRCISQYNDHVFHMQEKEISLKAKYYSIEFDKDLKQDEKIPHMIEWWTRSNEIFVKSGICKLDVAEASLTPMLSLREGFVDLIKDFIKKDIPVLVASAGVGDVVMHKLRNEFGHQHNIELVSNFFIYDQNDVVSGVSSPMIHSYNKHIIADEKKEYFQKHTERNNVILFGDSVGDVNVLNGMANISTSLKVGFVNSDPEDHIQPYLNHYDIVLVDPSSIMPLIPIFEFILNPGL